MGKKFFVFFFGKECNIIFEGIFWHIPNIMNAHFWQLHGRKNSFTKFSALARNHCSCCIPTWGAGWPDGSGLWQHGGISGRISEQRLQHFVALLINFANELSGMCLCGLFMIVARKGLSFLLTLQLSSWFLCVGQVGKDINHSSLSQLI